jgi:anti-sigma factor RsiW
MPDLDREVAGLSCRDVLADLSELLDGLLPDSRVAAIHAHLAGCETCARFGGSVGEIVAALRAERARDSMLGREALDALRARVQRAIASTSGA